MKSNEIKEIAGLFSSPEIFEVEIQETTKVIKITRSYGKFEQLSEVHQNSTEPEEKISKQSVPSEVSSEPGESHIASPMVGTFYRSPSPDAAPFVEVGQHVSADEIVCIVEAMKMMHQVPAGKAGVINAVMAVDGEMVEFDQPLITII